MNSESKLFPPNKQINKGHVKSYFCNSISIYKSNFKFFMSSNILFEYSNLNCFPLKHKDPTEVMSKSVALALMFQSEQERPRSLYASLVLRENSSDFLIHECNAHFDSPSITSL